MAVQLLEDAAAAKSGPAASCHCRDELSSAVASRSRCRHCRWRLASGRRRIMRVAVGRATRGFPEPDDPVEECKELLPASGRPLLM